MYERTLEGYSGSVSAVIFSLDRKTLTLGLDNRTI